MRTGELILLGAIAIAIGVVTFDWSGKVSAANNKTELLQKEIVELEQKLSAQQRECEAFQKGVLSAK